MNYHWKNWIILAALALLITVTPVSMAQSPPAPISLYSVWVRLSLRGLTQGEIESLMRNMDPKSIDQVKQRLRTTVISNLEFKRIRERFLSSRDSDDLAQVLVSIGTEIRFAGMENDEELRLMIKNRFGVQLDRF